MESMFTILYEAKNCSEVDVIVAKYLFKLGSSSRSRFELLTKRTKNRILITESKKRKSDLIIKSILDENN